MFYYWTKVDYKNYESYNFGFKIIFILGEGAMCVYYLLFTVFCLFVSLRVIYWLCVQLLVAFMSMNLCVYVYLSHAWHCACVVKYAVGIQVWHPLSLIREISYRNANDVFFCLTLTVYETFQILFEINLVWQRL